MFRKGTIICVARIFSKGGLVCTGLRDVISVEIFIVDYTNLVDYVDSYVTVIAVFIQQIFYI